jgi:hypothetical protein
VSIKISEIKTQVLQIQKPLLSHNACEYLLLVKIKDFGRTRTAALASAHSDKFGNCFRNHHLNITGLKMSATKESLVPYANGAQFKGDF